MDGVHTNLEKEVTQLQKEVAECQAIINNVWDYISCKGELIHELPQLSTESLSPLRCPLVPTSRGGVQQVEKSMWPLLLLRLSPPAAFCPLRLVSLSEL